MIRSHTAKCWEESLDPLLLVTSRWIFLIPRNNFWPRVQVVSSETVSHTLQKHIKQQSLRIEQLTLCQFNEVFLPHFVCKELLATWRTPLNRAVVP
jgi:hypothetical protein